MLIVQSSATKNDLVELRDLMLKNPGDIDVMISVFKDGMKKNFKIKSKVNENTIKNVIPILVQLKMWFGGRGN